MTILSIIQTASDEVGIPRPSSVIGSTDNSARRLYAYLLRTAKDLRSREEWPYLRKEKITTLVDSQDAYALPGDFEAFINETYWDANNHWAIFGPLAPEEWQAKLRGVSAQSPRRMFTIKGMGDNKLYITPTPGASSAGQLIYYEYISANTILPKVWTSGESIGVGEYRSYNGNIYFSITNGSTGSTPPTHTTGNVSDGGVTWEYKLIKYTPTNDADFPVLDESLFVLGIIWRWRRQKGFDYTDSLGEYLDMIKKQLVNERGTRTISFEGGVLSTPGRWNVPDTGFGL